MLISFEINIEVEKFRNILVYLRIILENMEEKNH